MIQNFDNFRKKKHILPASTGCLKNPPQVIGNFIRKKVFLYVFVGCQAISSLRNMEYSVEPREKPSYFPLYWLVNRDPNNGLL